MDNSSDDIVTGWRNVDVKRLRNAVEVALTQEKRTWPDNSFTIWPQSQNASLTSRSTAVIDRRVVTIGQVVGVEENVGEQLAKPNGSGECVALARYSNDWIG